MIDSSPAIIIGKQNIQKECPARAPVLVLKKGCSAHHLPTLVRRMIPLFDGKKTVQEIYRAAALPRATSEAIVRKLISLGFLVEARENATSTALPRQPTAPFSSLEEDFFSAEIPPIDECDEPFETLSRRVRLLLERLRR